MRITLLAVLLVTAASALRPEEPETAALVCLKYACGNWTNTGTCLQTNSTNVLIQPCLAPLVCNTTTGLCATNPVPPASPGWPGEACSASNPCAYGNCTSRGICQGAAVGAVCAQHDQCDTGLMCNSTGVCAPLLPGGTAGCRSTFDCDYSSVCNKTFTESTGTCVIRGSVNLGQTVTDCNNSFSLMCGSNACKASNAQQFIGSCSPAIQSAYNMPVGCGQNADCVGTDGTNYYVGSCQCGMNPTGSAYCAPFWNDIPGITLRNTMQLVYGHSDRCNTVRRYTNACFTATGNLNRMMVASFGFNYYPQLQGNDKCIKAVFTATYWLNSAVALQLALMLSLA